jgi:hypothetical protein
MTNKLIVDVDTDRDVPVKISKPNSFDISKISGDVDAMKSLLKNDVISLIAAASFLLKTAESNGMISGVKYLYDDLDNLGDHINDLFNK